MDGDRAPGQCPHLVAGRVTDQLQPRLGHHREDLGKDRLRQPERRVHVRRMAETSDEDDRRRSAPNRVEGPFGNVHRERDPRQDRTAGGRTDSIHVALGEDNDGAEPRPRSALVAPPGSRLKPAHQASRPARRVAKLVCPGRRGVVVDEHAGEPTPRDRLDVLRHHLEVDLDEIGPPLVEQALERVRVLAAAAVRRPRWQAA